MVLWVRSVPFIQVGFRCKKPCRGASKFSLRRKACLKTSATTCDVTSVFCICRDGALKLEQKNSGGRGSILSSIDRPEFQRGTAEQDFAVHYGFFRKKLI